MATIPAIALGVLLILLIGGAAGLSSKKPEFLGHPKGLYILFFAEMWERFSYYGMRALLIFYLTKHWLFADGQANLVYGAYTSLVYITPVLGGYLADKYLGQRKAVLFGALILTAGHLLMAFEGTGGQADPTINIFWLALSCIVVGSGFLKANISVIVGQLYGLTDPRRDGAYTIFYVGINVGAAIGTIMAGWLGETYGWKYGFGAAGLGMLLGALVFILGKPWLMGQGEPPRLLTKQLEWGLYGIGIASIAVIWFLVQYQSIIQNLLIVSGIGLLGYVMFSALKLEPHARDRMFAILFLIALNPVFWGLFEQAGGSLNLYTDRYVDRGGVPASLFQSINPIYIVLLGPVFAWLWVFLGKRGWEPSAPAKFGLALAQVGFSFLIFVWGAQSVGMAALTPVIFVFLVYLFQTTGELCLSPVGLSAMNRLAPKHLASLIMGAWFYMTAVGNFVAGKIGEATGGHGGEMTKEGTLAVYSTIGWWTVGIAVAVLAVSPVIRKLMHLDTLRDDPPPTDDRPEEGLRVTPTAN
ncbi:peptide MFS transporter [Sphingobium lignivorans]|uniref:POT family proton-dependent oligopeptide transporter n=1 Tax=Sphingobium lignivorans TaxID=2735886 RepID=A0ABR6NFV2_9SPHN|nr:peptide MFS transporter [Sphingobium lignivorans]MBB5986173.1 POT family proton-dependent oligopeptide transporter [Sphingobium lignivorans]